MKKITNKSLIIDDYVHRIIDPNRLNIINDRHLIIDSLRKNTPLPGSFTYTSKTTFNKLRRPSTLSFIYGLKVIFYFFRYRFTLLMGDILGNKFLIKYAHLTLLKTHDNLVGDSKRGYSGLPWIPAVHNHLNISKIRTLKIKQVTNYQKELAPILKTSKLLSIPNIKLDDIGELHAFPIIVDLLHSKEIEEALSNINVWAKFTDSTWSKTRRVFFLPLGFHITTNDQRLITSTIIKSLQTT